MKTSLVPIRSNRSFRHEILPQHRAQVYGNAYYGVSVSVISDQDILPFCTVKSVIKWVPLRYRKSFEIHIRRIKCPCVGGFAQRLLVHGACEPQAKQESGLTRTDCLVGDLYIL